MLVKIRIPLTSICYGYLVVYSKLTANCMTARSTVIEGLRRIHNILGCCTDCCKNSVQQVHRDILKRVEFGFYSGCWDDVESVRRRRRRFRDQRTDWSTYNGQRTKTLLLFMRDSRMLRAAWASVRRSVTLLYYVKTVQARITKFLSWLHQGL